MTTPYEDLHNRWMPSKAQIAAANAALEDPAVAMVLTGHFLGGKEYGVWTLGIEIEHADGVHVAYDSHVDYRPAQNAASVDGATLGADRPGTVGYTVHRRNDHWAVFEEILSPSEVIRYSKAGVL